MNAQSSPNKQSILLEVGTNEVEFLITVVGNQKYGMNVSKICQISLFDSRGLVEMPDQHPNVLGVMSIRGETVTIVDLGLTLNRNKSSSCERSLLILAEFNNRKTGFVVEGVDKIERVNWNRFEPFAGSCSQGNSSSVVGMVTSPEGLTIILDLESILAAIDPSMSVEHYANQIQESAFPRDEVRILHCEDSMLLQKLVRQVLTSAGFTQLEQVSNGKAALDYAQRVGPSGVDIILSDIEMPVMDGLTLCKELRINEQFKKTPIVFFSSMINEQMMKKCELVGGDAAFSKPQINSIVGCIEKLVNVKK